MRCGVAKAADPRKLCESMFPKKKFNQQTKQERFYLLK
jgi:hypothetical protein